MIVQSSLNRRSALLFGASAAVTLTACNKPTTQSGAGSPAGPATHGIDIAGMDTASKPGDDFFRYCNGHWFDTTQIPADQSRWGAFNVLADRSSQRTSDLIQGLAKTQAAAGSDEQKIGDYYASFMDEAAIEKLGLAPLKPVFDRIAAIADVSGLSREIGGQVRADVDPLNNTNYHTAHLFGLWVAQDFNHPERYAPYLLQGGLVLPDRDYYLDASPKMAAIRSSYLSHVTAVVKLTGASDADAASRAKSIVALETKIAQRHWSATQSRDVTKANNPWTRADFDTKAPGIDWTAFMDGAGLAAQHDFIAWQPSAITGLSALVKSEPLQAWKDYLAFVAAEEFSPVLTKAFADESFNFNGHILNGTPQQAVRWKRAVGSTNEALGFAVGKLYVQKYFPAEAKAKAQAMVQNILAAYRTRLQQVAWMSPQTRAKALEKLQTLRVGVGYPDKWRDYAGLQVTRGDAFGNLVRARQFEYRRNTTKLGTAVDRTEWQMTPQTVNAVNLPIQNGLNFPAAILDEPFFDPAAQPAVNFGGIGSVIGHEVSHSFDNQGALFDAQGRLQNWWTPADFAHFTGASEKLAKQYDAYAPFPDLHLNGHLTLGENIADVAGLTAAYDGWRLSLGGKPAPMQGQYNGEQQFFIGYGQAHRAKAREASLRKAVLTNEHAPDEFRADTVRNCDAWYQTFNVQAGQKLYLKPDDRVRIW